MNDETSVMNEPLNTNQEVVYYDDLVNRHCPKVARGVICYVTSDDECSMFAECIIYNAASAAAYR